MHSISHRQLIGLIATQFPPAMAVFRRFGIPFHLEGMTPLDQACAALELDPQEVLGELRAAEAAQTEPIPRWDLRPLPDLIDYLVDRFHRPLCEDLPRLEAEALELVGQSNAPSSELRALASVLSELREETCHHLAREEGVLFPWLRSGQGITAGMPMHAMHVDHRKEGELWQRVRQLTRCFQAPPDADEPCRRLWRELEALEAIQQEHMHLENNVLSPRAMQGG